MSCQIIGQIKRKVKFYPYSCRRPKRFLKELSKLPKEIQSNAEKIIFEELTSKNPFELGYIEHMTGYINKYKIRIGKYRIGITIEKAQKLIVCQRIAHRKEIYRIFP